MSILKQILDRFSRTAAQPAKPAPRPLQPLYVIGDIHGQAHLLDSLLEKIEADRQGRAAITVCVGDYIDRGERSREVLERLLQRTQEYPAELVCLMGNHEKMMLDFLDQPEAHGPRWLRHGGLQTLASFGVGGLTQSSSGPHLVSARDSLATALPSSMQSWLRRLPLSWASGSIRVVHAGVDPGLPLDDQKSETLLWGHPEFLQRPHARDDTWIVHGHTVMSQAEARAGRISVDTGAYFSGRLTAAVIAPGGDIRFLQT